MTPIKIKNETNRSIEVEAENILALVKNGTIDSPVKTLVMFKDDTFMFSIEEQETIKERVKEIKE